MKGQPSHRAAVVVDATATGPRSGRQAMEERERRRASRRVLGEEIVQRAALELSMFRILFFIKAWQLAVFTAGHAQEAVRKDALVIDQVTEHALQSPFSRAVREPAVRGCCEGAEEGRGVLVQPGQSVDGIVARDRFNVCARVVGVFAGERAPRSRTLFGRRNT